MSVPLNILCVIVIFYFLLTFLEVMVSYLPSYFTFNSSLAVKSVHLKFLVIFDTTSRDVCKFLAVTSNLNLLLLSHIVALTAGRNT